MRAIGSPALVPSSPWSASCSPEEEPLSSSTTHHPEAHHPRPAKPSRCTLSSPWDPRACPTASFSSNEDSTQRGSFFGSSSCPSQKHSHVPLFSLHLSPPRWFHVRLTEAALSALPCCFRCCTCGVSTRVTGASSDEAGDNGTETPDASTPVTAGKTSKKGLPPSATRTAASSPSDQEKEGTAQLFSGMGDPGRSGNTPVLLTSPRDSPPSDASASPESFCPGGEERPCGSRRGKRKARTSGLTPFLSRMRLTTDVSSPSSPLSSLMTPDNSSSHRRRPLARRSLPCFPTYNSPSHAEEVRGRVLRGRGRHSASTDGSSSHAIPSLSEEKDLITSPSPHPALPSLEDLTTGRSTTTATTTTTAATPTTITTIASSSSAVPPSFLVSQKSFLALPSSDGDQKRRNWRCCQKGHTKNLRSEPSVCSPPPPPVGSRKPGGLKLSAEATIPTPYRGEESWWRRSASSPGMYRPPHNVTNIRNSKTPKETDGNILCFPMHSLLPTYDPAHRASMGGRSWCLCPCSCCRKGEEDSPSLLQGKARRLHGEGTEQTGPSLHSLCGHLKSRVLEEVDKLANVIWEYAFDPRDWPALRCVDHAGEAYVRKALRASLRLLELYARGPPAHGSRSAWNPSLRRLRRELPSLLSDCALSDFLSPAIQPPSSLSARSASQASSSLSRHLTRKRLAKNSSSRLSSSPAVGQGPPSNDRSGGMTDNSRTNKGQSSPCLCGREREKACFSSENEEQHRQGEPLQDQAMTFLPLESGCGEWSVWLVDSQSEPQVTRLSPGVAAVLAGRLSGGEGRKEAKILAGASKTVEIGGEWLDYTEATVLVEPAREKRRLPSALSRSSLEVASGQKPREGGRGDQGQCREEARKSIAHSGSTQPAESRRPDTTDTVKSFSRVKRRITTEDVHVTEKGSSEQDCRAACGLRSPRRSSSAGERPVRTPPHCQLPRLSSLSASSLSNLPCTSYSPPPPRTRRRAFLKHFLSCYRQRLTEALTTQALFTDASGAYQTLPGHVFKRVIETGTQSASPFTATCAVYRHQLRNSPSFLSDPAGGFVLDIVSSRPRNTTNWLEGYGDRILRTASVCCFPPLLPHPLRCPRADYLRTRPVRAEGVAKHRRKERGSEQHEKDRSVSCVPSLLSLPVCSEGRRVLGKERPRTRDASSLPPRVGGGSIIIYRRCADWVSALCHSRVWEFLFVAFSKGLEHACAFLSLYDQAGLPSCWDGYLHGCPAISRWGGRALPLPPPTPAASSSSSRSSSAGASEVPPRGATTPRYASASPAAALASSRGAACQSDFSREQKRMGQPSLSGRETMAKTSGPLLGNGGAKEGATKRAAFCSWRGQQEKNMTNDDKERPAGAQRHQCRLRDGSDWEGLRNPFYRHPPRTRSSGLGPPPDASLWSLCRHSLYQDYTDPVPIWRSRPLLKLPDRAEDRGTVRDAAFQQLLEEGASYCHLRRRGYTRNGLEIPLSSVSLSSGSSFHAAQALGGMPVSKGVDLRAEEEGKGMHGVGCREESSPSSFASCGIPVVDEWGTLHSHHQSFFSEEEEGRRRGQGGSFNAKLLSRGHTEDWNEGPRSLVGFSWIRIPPFRPSLSTKTPCCSCPVPVSAYHACLNEVSEPSSDTAVEDEEERSSSGTPSASLSEGAHKEGGEGGGRRGRTGGGGVPPQPPSAKRLEEEEEREQGGGVSSYRGRGKEEEEEEVERKEHLLKNNSSADYFVGNPTRSGKVSETQANVKFSSSSSVSLSSRKDFLADEAALRSDPHTDLPASSFNPGGYIGRTSADRRASLSSSYHGSLLSPGPLFAPANDVPPTADTRPDCFSSPTAPSLPHPLLRPDLRASSPSIAKYPNPSQWHHLTPNDFFLRSSSSSSSEDAAPTTNPRQSSPAFPLFAVSPSDPVCSRDSSSCSKRASSTSLVDTAGPGLGLQSSASSSDLLEKPQCGGEPPCTSFFPASSLSRPSCHPDVLSSLPLFGDKSDVPTSLPDPDSAPTPLSPTNFLLPSACPSLHTKGSLPSDIWKTPSQLTHQLTVVSTTAVPPQETDTGDSSTSGFHCGTDLPTGQALEGQDNVPSQRDKRGPPSPSSDAPASAPTGAGATVQADVGGELLSLLGHAHGCDTCPHSEEGHLTAQTRTAEASFLITPSMEVDAAGRPRRFSSIHGILLSPSALGEDSTTTGPSLSTPRQPVPPYGNSVERVQRTRPHNTAAAGHTPPGRSSPPPLCCHLSASSEREHHQTTTPPALGLPRPRQSSGGLSAYQRRAPRHVRQRRYYRHPPQRFYERLSRASSEIGRRLSADPVMMTLPLPVLSPFLDPLSEYLIPPGDSRRGRSSRRRSTRDGQARLSISGREGQHQGTILVTTPGRGSGGQGPEQDEMTRSLPVGSGEELLFAGGEKTPATLDRRTRRPTVGAPQRLRRSSSSGHCGQPLPLFYMQRQTTSTRLHNTPPSPSGGASCTTTTGVDRGLLACLPRTEARPCADHSEDGGCCCWDRRVRASPTSSRHARTDSRTASRLGLGALEDDGAENDTCEAPSLPSGFPCASSQVVGRTSTSEVSSKVGDPRSTPQQNPFWNQEDRKGERAWERRNSGLSPLLRRLSLGDFPPPLGDEQVWMQKTQEPTAEAAAAGGGAVFSSPLSSDRNDPDRHLDLPCHLRHHGAIQIPHWEGASRNDDSSMSCRSDHQGRGRDWTQDRSTTTHEECSFLPCPRPQEKGDSSSSLARYIKQNSLPEAALASKEAPKKDEAKQAPCSLTLLLSAPAADRLRGKASSSPAPAPLPHTQAPRFSSVGHGGLDDEDADEPAAIRQGFVQRQSMAEAEEDFRQKTDTAGSRCPNDKKDSLGTHRASPKMRKRKQLTCCCGSSSDSPSCGRAESSLSIEGGRGGGAGEACESEERTRPRASRRRHGPTPTHHRQAVAEERATRLMLRRALREQRRNDSAGEP